MNLSIDVDPEVAEGVTAVERNQELDDDIRLDAATSPVSSDEANDEEFDDCPLAVGAVTCWRHAKSPRDFGRLSLVWIKCNKSQVLSGLTVALAQVPEAVSFSFVAGVDPIVGLQSAWIMGLTTSLVGGRPGMIAGATGAVAVVLTNLVETKGVGHMFYAIMLAGIIQMAFGVLKLGVVVRMVPHPVMVGFCNGLGLIVALSQFNIFKVRYEGDAGERRLTSLHIGGLFAPFTNGLPWVDATIGLWMTFLIIVTLLTYILFPKVTKAIPGSLAGIVVATALEWGLIRPLGFETITVKDLAAVAGSFPSPIWIDTTYGYRYMLPPFTGQLIGEILSTAITAAAVGLLESLLTLQLIDDITNTKGSVNREAFGQGLGQFISGMFGGMGGCTTIGQSLMNIHSGGITRLSSTIAALVMLCIILAAYPLINLIPVASLAGVMFVVTFFTIEWESGWVILGSALPQSLREKYGLVNKVKRSDVFIMLTVIAVTLVLDLAIAVAIGIMIACLVFAWDSGARTRVERNMSDDQDKVTYIITGPIFFGSVKPLLEKFSDTRDDPRDVVVLLENAEIHDWSGMVAIKAIHDRFEANGSNVQFERLTVTSRRLMSKSKKLWEGVSIFMDDDLEEDFKDPIAYKPSMFNEYDAHL